MLDFDLSYVTSSEEMTKAFYRLAIKLMTEHAIELRHLNGRPRIRISSVELYLHKPGVWEDRAVHKWPLQANAAGWYVHRRGKNYRGATRRCVDITCGCKDVNAYGGLLIRGVENIDGPALALNQIVFGRPERPRCWDYSQMTKFFEQMEKRSVWDGDVRLVDASPLSSAIYIGRRLNLKYRDPETSKEFDESKLRISTRPAPGDMCRLDK
jgi:hypothetical protein